MYRYNQCYTDFIKPVIMFATTVHTIDRNKEKYTGWLSNNITYWFDLMNCMDEIVYDSDVQP